MQHGDTRRRILILNGPNLGSLGTRQPDIYGTASLDDLIADLARFGEKRGVEITHRQTDDEAELISLVAASDADGIVLNAGALAHTSRALGDAVRASGIPTVEVHISNVKAREPWRGVSLIEEACVATIWGRGLTGYRDAILHLVNRWASPFQVVRYGPHPLNVGELRPGKGLVVLIHGGIWRPQYGRDGVESLAVDLSLRGLATWNIGYRRIGEGGGWPGSAHDVLTALDHAARLSPGPIVVLGHSAGGYLGLWASARTSTEVALVVALAPIADLELARADGGEIARESGLLLDSGAPPRPRPEGVPVLVVHCDDDRLVPPSHAKGLTQMPGVEAEFFSGGHFDLIDPSKPHWETIAGTIQRSLGELA